ncbi:MAG: cytochrome c oxidase accessory protein CcoG [Cytophagales bacterium]|nr:cytochrome c oxidase accessory protein CcoG [Cytophagales bacterium]
METLEEVYDEAGFRDEISTIDKEGKRIWVYPKKPKGRFHNWRLVVSIALLAFLFLAPIIKIGGQPLLLFNVFERRFVIFGQIFWPQDFHLFVIGMITSVVFIILFTVAYGRIFCGWVCPQTIFMEMVFRKVEYWIEGDYMAQKKLRKQPWDTEKILKKGGKHAIFLSISFLIMHTFISYLIGFEDTIALVQTSPTENMAGFIAMIGFTGAFYGVFAKLREQVCTTICPYGRFQGVMLDRNSVVVAYDHVRGEARGKFRKTQDRPAIGLGDCIDCHQCVQVCPTGIDIRNGTQLECVNCTACIDACDNIMDKVGLDRGLIRYASEANIADGKPFEFTTRLKAYTGVLIVLMGVMVALLVLRSDIEATILRTPGMLYQEQAENKVSNLYNFKVVNKTLEEVPFEFRLENVNGEIKMVGDLLPVDGQSIGEGAMFIHLDRSALTGMSTKIEIGVYAEDEKLETINTTFLGPNL